VAVSVADPINQAIERTRRMLFKPFNAGKWFTFGSCAFLAQLGEGCGGNYGGKVVRALEKVRPAGHSQRGMDWLRTNRG
jgi:hypothetical protein